MERQLNRQNTAPAGSAAWNKASDVRFPVFFRSAFVV